MVDVLIHPILIWACIDSLKHSMFIKKPELQVLICVEYAPTTEMFKVKFLLFKELNLMWESENHIGIFQIGSRDKKHSMALRGHRCAGWGTFLSHVGDCPEMPQT